MTDDEYAADDLPRLWPAAKLAPSTAPRWLARNRLPRAAISLLVGDEGIGKSLTWVWLAAAITTGKPLPGFGIPARDPEHIVLVVTEDDWSTAVRPRLEVAGADLSYIKVLCIERDGSGTPTFPLHIGMIGAADPRPALVVVDAWLDTLPGGLQVRDPQQARQALHPWRDLATAIDAAVLLVCHTNRIATANARDRYGATGALRQKARMTLYAQMSDDGHLVIGPEKTNSSAPVPASTFIIKARCVFAPTDDSDGTVPLLEYVGESELTARQHLAENIDGERDGEDKREVDEFLQELLSRGPLKATEVYKALDAAGYSKDQGKRAKKRVGVDAVKSSGDGPWLWALSQGCAKGVGGARVSQGRALAPSQVTDGADTRPWDTTEQQSNGVRNGAPPLPSAEGSREVAAANSAAPAPCLDCPHAPAPGQRRCQPCQQTHDRAMEGYNQ